MNRCLILKVETDVLSLSRRIPPTSNPSLPSHKYNPIASLKPAKGIIRPTYGLNFADYDESITFLSKLDHFPELRAQVIAHLHSDWKPAIYTALHEFWERLRCRECGEIPGEGRHKLGESVKRQLVDLIQEMRWVDVRFLDEKMVVMFQKRLKELEVEVLEANGVMEKDLRRVKSKRL